MRRHAARGGEGTDTGPSRVYLRLWPLYFLMPVGLVIGAFWGRWVSDRLGSSSPWFDIAMGCAYGLAGGTIVMILAALVVLAVRLARRQFTIAGLLMTVFAAALVLWLIRSV